MKKSAVNIPKVPNLRFKNDDGNDFPNWGSKKLGEICDINPKNSTLPNSFIYIDLESVVKGVLFKEERILKENAPSRAQRVLEKKDILFQMVRPYQKNNFYFDVEGDYVASTGYAQIRTKQNSKFIFQYLHNQKFVDQVIERCTGTSYPAINSTDLSNIPLFFPTPQEQEKIADYLCLVDQRIQTQNKIIEELKLLKDGLIKKIFSLQYRFKDINGNNYLDWEIKKLGDIGETYNGLTGKTKANFGTGKPFIQYKQIFDHSKIDISKCDFVSITSNEKQNQVKKGDVFFTVSSETPEEIGMSSVLLDEVEEAYLNSFCFGYRPHSFESLYPSFARHLFRSNVFRNEIIKLAQGSTRYNLSKIALMKLGVNIPCIQEQIKIADFFSMLDNKNSIEQCLLKQLKIQKKYLLQNLFI